MLHSPSRVEARNWSLAASRRIVFNTQSLAQMWFETKKTFEKIDTWQPSLKLLTIYPDWKFFPFTLPQLIWYCLQLLVYLKLVMFLLIDMTMTQYLCVGSNQPLAWCMGTGQVQGQPQRIKSQVNWEHFKYPMLTWFAWKPKFLFLCFFWLKLWAISAPLTNFVTVYAFFLKN